MGSFTSSCTQTNITSNAPALYVPYSCNPDEYYDNTVKTCIKCEVAIHGC